MINKTPLVSVVLPVHNGEQFVRDAVQSILDQTYKNFELLILISATTNKESSCILNSFTDKRIRLIYRTPEEILPKALNRGIRESKGKYIARMDADDISLPNRLEEQVSFMEIHEDIGIVGTWVKTLGTGKNFINKGLTLPEDIRANLLFYTSLVHPSTMLRTSLLEKFNLEYDGTFTEVEDYDMWIRCSVYFPITNINKVLLFYRVHKNSKFQTHRKEVRDVTYKIRLKLLQNLGLLPSLEEMITHNSLNPAKGENIDIFLKKESEWLSKIIEANVKTNIYTKESLSKIIYNRWYSICRANTKEGLLVLKKFIQSPLFRIKKSGYILDCIKMSIKCVLKNNFFNKVNF